MNRIQVFEPALCCASGVCGEDVDQGLVTFSADMDFVRSQGGEVSRYNLASEPLVFAETEAVRGFLQVVGSKGLPLVLVDGVTAMTGGYPRSGPAGEVGRLGRAGRRRGGPNTGRGNDARPHRGGIHLWRLLLQLRGG
jgi:hypothetical protein